jgi:beta-xylosidase
MKVIIRLLACLVLISALALTARPASAIAPSTNDTWQDEFSSTTLSPHWAWDYETPDHWSLTANPGYMRITTKADQGGFNNILQTYASIGNYMIETQVLFEPTENYQIAGLMVFLNGDNYLQFGRAFCADTQPGCVGNGIYFDHVAGGVFDGSNFAVATPSSPGNAYLRIVHRNGVYTGYFSADGITWLKVGEHPATFQGGPIFVGLHASNQIGISSEINADFNYFKMTTLNGFHEEFYNEPLNPRWQWWNEVPDHWSLSENSGFMTMTTQAGVGGLPNYLYTTMPSNLSEVMTRMYFEPTENFQFAGIMLYKDSQNSLQFGRAFCGYSPPGCTNGTGIYFDYVRNGKMVGSNFATAIPYTGDADFLRLVKIGTYYYGFYSTNGGIWTLIGKHRVTFTPLYLGLRASAQAPIASGEVDALFDFIGVIYGPRIISISPR